MNGTELRSFGNFHILIKIAYLDLRRSHSRLSNSNVNMIYKCFPGAWNRIKKF